MSALIFKATVSFCISSRHVPMQHLYLVKPDIHQKWCTDGRGLTEVATKYGFGEYKPVKRNHRYPKLLWSCENFNLVHTKTVDSVEGAPLLASQTPNILCYLPRSNLGKDGVPVCIRDKWGNHPKLIFCGVYYLTVAITWDMKICREDIEFCNKKGDIKCLFIFDVIMPTV